jgi:hypothetical protein
MLKPLPDFDNEETMLKLGRLYALQNAWKDALAELRDCVTLINGNDQYRDEALQRLDAVIERLKTIARAL